MARTLAAAGALTFMATLSAAQQPPAPQPDPSNLEVQKVNSNDVGGVKTDVLRSGRRSRLS
jgi:hypothetical protein